MSEPKSINELVNDALFAWARVTGTDPSKCSFTLGGFSSDFNNYNLKDILKDLNASRDLDPSGITTFMMLRGYMEKFLKQKTFTAESLILSPAKVEKELASMRALRDSLENPQVAAITDEFENSLRQAVLHYGVTNPLPFEELLADKLDLALIRRDALRSLETLRPFQFTQGEGDKQPLKYGKKVYEFWNINSVLAAMRSQKVPGIMLCLLRDPENALNSYFAFAVANGGTITILTDAENYAHPEQKSMLRRLDKMMVERASKHWFPYHLLEVEVSADQRSLYAKARTALVPTNVEAVPVADVSALPPSYFVWTTLVFELIRKRYWTENHLLPELSYTAEMIEVPDALVGAHGGLVRSGAYKPLELPRLTMSDITTEKLAGQFEEKATSHNQWLMDRYADRVPEAILNVVGASKMKLLAGTVERDVHTGLKQEPGTALLPPIPTGHFEGQMLRHSYKFSVLAPTTFGTAAEVARDRVWTARHNQVQAVQRFVNDEFAKEEDNLKAWCKARLAANQEFLLDCSARGELIAPAVPNHRVYETERVSASANIIDQWAEPEQKRDYSHHWTGFTLDGKPVERRSHHTCVVYPEKRANVFTKFSPTTPEALAVLFGVALDALPWQLRHYAPFEPRTGNHILDRLDPIDWALHNPWNELNMSVKVCVNKTAFNERRKAIGLPRKEWPTKKET